MKTDNKKESAMLTMTPTRKFTRESLGLTLAATAATAFFVFTGGTGPSHSDTPETAGQVFTQLDDTCVTLHNTVTSGYAAIEAAGHDQNKINKLYDLEKACQ